MKISLIHPSRGRAEKAKATYDNWMQKASGEIEIEYILSLDLDDNYDEYKRVFGEHYNCVLAFNKNLVEAANVGVSYSHGDLIILISDDFECFDLWDATLKNFLVGKKDFVLKTFDGIQDWIVTLPIMDRVYYKKQGYLYYPEYHHMFCDTDLTHKSELQGKLIIRNDLLFKHNHYSVGGCKKDAINIKADATCAKGESLYLQRVKNNFGLTENTCSLSDNANSHINWLKNKL